MNKKIPSTQELKLFWNTFQKDYTKIIEPNMQSLFVLLFNSSNILNPFNNKNQNQNKNKKIILEPACGGGAGLEYMCNELHKRNIEADIYGTDISNNMLDYTFNRLKNTDYINIDFIDKDYNNKKICNNAKINLYLKEADNENMPFEENKFDMIIANLSLHLVSNPDKMLKECKRLLKPQADSFAYFSIWGRHEYSLPYTVIANNLKKANIELPNERSNFHLSKHEKLRDLFERNGIKKFKIQTTFIPYNFTKGEDFLFMLKNGFNIDDIIKDCTEEKKKEIINNIVKDVDNAINGEGFFGAEAFILRSAKF
jgi:ubiquinone/menaquinone biosynthesis C-methylase UbiE